MTVPDYIQLSAEIVALQAAVILHGLPLPI